MCRRIAFSAVLVMLLAAAARGVEPNIPGTISVNNGNTYFVVGPRFQDVVVNIPVYVNAPALATGPAVEIIAWIQEVGNVPQFVNGPILIDTAPLGSFNPQDFDTPGVDLITGTVLASNHGSSPARSIVPPAPPSTAGVGLIQVGVATQNGNPAPVGTWNGLLATLRVSIPAAVLDGVYHLMLEDHPTQGSTSLGGFFDENFEFIINQPDIINGTIYVCSLCPEPGSLAMAAMAAVALVGIGIRRRRVETP